MNINLNPNRHHQGHPEKPTPDELSTPLGDFVFVLRFIEGGELRVDDLGGFGLCAICYTDRLAMTLYRQKYRLTEWCDIHAYSQRTLIDICHRQGCGLAIDNRVLLAEMAMKGVSK